MGLDIYFSKMLKDPETDENFHKEVQELAYFRKVNSLVAFFEHNYGYDREDSVFPITKEMCIELLDSCRAVLRNHSLAEDLMPTTGGFFFGSEEYDEHYYNDIQNVIDSLEDSVIPEFDNLRKDEYIAFVTSW